MAKQTLLITHHAHALNEQIGFLLGVAVGEFYGRDYYFFQTDSLAALLALKMHVVVVMGVVGGLALVFTAGITQAIFVEYFVD